MKTATMLGRGCACACACAVAVLIHLVPASPAAEPPHLEVETWGDWQVRLAWPEAATGFVVEHRPELEGADPWRVWPTLPTLEGNEWTVIVPATSQASFFRLRSVFDGILPPDPEDVAPPLDPGVASDVGSSVAFLYSGATPIQTGVTNGTIVTYRSAALRGRVHQADGQPLSGVLVSVTGHPEFGRTLSQTNGAFDLVVNGGGPIRLSFRKAGLLEAWRVVGTPWADYVRVPDVALVTEDARKTVVPLTNAVAGQLAQGSPVADERGSRQAGVFFPAGVGASIITPGGETQPVGQLTVRLTEYTVGTNGPAAMPLPLPPGVAYTYAVNLGAEEAQAKVAGRDVLFDRPVYFYVDNFIGFPTATRVPVAFVDNDRGAWVPEPDGQVIQLLEVNAQDLVDVDANGDGAADDAAQLAALGITDDERRQLAAGYGPQRSLWRVGLTHFSMCDLNFPYYSGNNQPPSIDFSQIFPNSNSSTDPNSAHPPATVAGYGTVDQEHLAFEETLPVVGTPLTLNYTSRRVPGYAPPRLEIPLTGEVLPDELTGVDLTIWVAGNAYLTRQFAPQTNLTTEFVWDGRDAYGREVYGHQPVTIEVAYRYPQYYGYSPAVAASFGLPASQVVTPRRRLFFDGRAAQSYQTTLEARPPLKPQSVGGWTLSVHHLYDPVGRTLYFGDGVVIRGTESRAGEIIETVAGNGTTTVRGTDQGAATGVGLSNPWDVAAAADGSFYIADGAAVRKVDPQGQITFVHRIGAILGPTGIAVAVNGDCYVGSLFAVWRVTLAGQVTRFAGTGANGFSGDGGFATNAAVSSVYGLAVTPDGSVYFSDSVNHRIRRVGPDGRIHTVAGSGATGFGQGGFGGDGGRATEARLNDPRDVAVAPDGTLYIADYLNHRVRRVSSDGIISTMAGTGQAWPDQDGVPATEAGLSNPSGVALSRSGSLYLADAGRVRRVGTDGALVTIAGVRNGGFEGDGGPAAAGRLSPFGLSVGADDRLYIADLGNHRVRCVRPSLPGAGGADVVIASRNANEVYAFDSSGRHLRTLHGRTGTTLWAFGYDGAGLLVSATDAAGNRATIQRDSDGKPTALIAPQGQRTTVSCDTEGWLVTLTNPAGETTRVAHARSGLLERIVSPRADAGAYAIEYDRDGFVSRVSDPAEGFTAFARTVLEHGTEVVATSATGQTTRTRTETLPNGNRLSYREHSTGSWQRSETTPAGEERTTTSEGVVTVTRLAADPRFGMHAPRLGSSQTRLPSGLTTTTTLEVTVSMSTNVPGELRAITNVAALNGRAGVAVFDAASRTSTEVSRVGRRLQHQTDAAGRRTGSVLAGVAPMTQTYDERGRLSQTVLGDGPDRLVTTHQYAAEGNVARTVDPSGQINEFVHDAAGRVLRTIGPDGEATRFAHDADGNLTSVTPPGQATHRLAYSPVNLLTAYAPPAVDGQTHWLRRFYDADRRLSGVCQADGQSLTNRYETSGRLVETRIPQGSYAFSHLANGQLASVAAPGGVELTHTYDGRLPVSTTWSGAVTGRIDRVYDSDLHLQSLMINGGQEVTFSYDADGFPTSAGLCRIEHHPDNRLLTGSVLGDFADTYEYSVHGQPTGYTASFRGTVIARFRYTRDRLNRIIAKEETIEGATTSWAYTYDLAGRLIEVRQDGVLTARYGYDANGNRVLTQRLVGGGLSTTTTTYDAADRLRTATTDVPTTSVTFSYSAQGDLTNRTVTGARLALAHDPLGNLREVTLPDGRRLEYVIDGENRRVGRRVGGVLDRGFLYDEWLRPVAELDATGAARSLFVMGGRSELPDYLVREGVAYRFVADHTGSPRLVINTTTGAVVQRLDFDEFGRVLRDTHPGFQPFGFAGGLRDPDTGLLRFGLRDYDPDTGRWLSRDPLLFAGGSENLYAYARNDPVNLHDPTGAGPTAFNPNAVMQEVNAGLATAMFAMTPPLAPGHINLVGVVADHLNYNCGTASVQRNDYLAVFLNSQAQYGTWQFETATLPSGLHTMSYLTYTTDTGVQLNFVADNYVLPMVCPAWETGQMGSVQGNPGRIVSYPGGNLIVAGIGK